MERSQKVVDEASPPRPRGSIFHAGILLCLLFFATSLPACQKADQVLTLALLGDINLGRGVNPAPDSLAYLAPHLSTADLSLANLESPLGENSSLEPYDLCAPGGDADLMADWGLDILSLVNNHADDCSPEGDEATRSFLTAAGLTALGSQPVRLEAGGLRISFLAFEDILAPLEVETAVEAVRSASEQGDLVVVSMHWGLEYQGAPTSRQEATADLMAEAGADLIWGHHPHVLQPARWIETTNGRTLVLYSLGNALFDQGGLDDTRRSALVLVSLSQEGVSSFEIFPFEIDVPGSRVIEADAEAAAEIIDRLMP